MTTGMVEISAVWVEVAEKFPVKSLAETAKEKTALSEALATVEVAVVVLIEPLLLIIK